MPVHFSKSTSISLGLLCLQGKKFQDGDDIVEYR